MNLITIKIFASHPIAEKTYEHLLTEYSDFHLAPDHELASVGIFDCEISSIHAELVLKHRLFPKLRPILLLSNCSEVSALHWLRSGVWGIVPHSRYQEDLPKAIRLVSSGHFWIQASVLCRQIHFAPTVADKAATLTVRESEVMNLLLQGCANKEISTQLRICERTVKFHVSSILRKTEVSSRRDLLHLQKENEVA